MTDDAGPTDALIARLKARAADPVRRLDHRPTQFIAGLEALDLSGLLGQLRHATADLQRVVEGNRRGEVAPDLSERAERLAADMAIPTPSRTPMPATNAALDAAEARLGFPLPAALRRVYAEVGDGGFGPGTGLLPIERVATRYLDVQQEVPRTQRWPDRLLPLVDDNPVLACLDAATPEGRLVSWDPDGLSERGSDRAWQGSFHDASPSLARWLGDWLET